MPLAALEKIAALVKAGAIVVGPQPAGPAGLVTPEQTENIESLAALLWANASGENQIGSGRVIAGKTPGEVLQEMRIPPDMAWSGLSSHGDLDWIHRQTADAGIYFVASRWDGDHAFAVLSAQPSLDRRQIERKQMKLAMSVGDSRHYRVDEIRGRHFIQMAMRAGLSRRIAEETLDAVATTTEAAFDLVEAKLPTGFPRKIHTSIKAGTLQRMKQMGAD